MTTRTALLIDDDPELYTALASQLSRDGFRLGISASGQQATELCRLEHPAVVVVKVELADVSGLTVCRALRSRSEFQKLPIILFSAGTAEADRLAAFDAGANDYVVKPFFVSELAARIRVHTRVAPPSGNAKLVWQNVVIDRETRIVSVSEAPVSLTPIEYHLLVALMSRPDVIFSREELIALVWEHHDVTIRNVDVAIRRLRRKLEACDVQRPVIRSARGFGYTLAKSPVRTNGTPFDQAASGR